MEKKNYKQYTLMVIILLVISILTFESFDG